jgi:hypothetical protein
MLQVLFSLTALNLVEHRSNAPSEGNPVKHEPAGTDKVENSILQTGCFSVSPKDGICEGYETTELRIRFAPQACGPASGDVHIAFKAIDCAASQVPPIEFSIKVSNHLQMAHSFE